MVINTSDYPPTKCIHSGFERLLRRTLRGFQPEIERRKWRGLKYQEIEHKKGSLFDDLLANLLKMLWFISFGEYTYKEST